MRLAKPLLNQPTNSRHWMEALDDLTGIHARFASLLRKLGDLDQRYIMPKKP
jgi:hypothetical protein